LLIKVPIYFFSN